MVSRSFYRTCNFGSYAYMKINYGIFRTLYSSSEINADHQLELLGKNEKKNHVYMCILLNKHQTFKLKKDIAQREFKIMNPLIPLVRGSKHIETLKIDLRTMNHTSSV